MATAEFQTNKMSLIVGIGTSGKIGCSRGKNNKTKQILLILNELK